MKQKFNKILDSVKNKFQEMTEVEEETKNKSEKPTKCEKCEPQNIEFTYKNVVQSTLIVIGLIALTWVLVLIKSIIFLFFVAILFAAALDPMVDKLEQHKVPRGLAVISIFIVGISVLIVFLGTLIPIVQTESVNILLGLQGLAGNILEGNLNLPDSIEFINVHLRNTFANLNPESLLNQVNHNLSSSSGDIASLGGNVVSTTFKTIGAVFSFLLSTIFVLLLTYYFTVDERIVDGFIQSIFPRKHHKYIREKTSEIKVKIGKWLRGQLMLMIAVGVSVYIGLKILGIKYAFTLAFFAGLTELIPVIGPWIGLVPAIPVAANISGTAVLWVLILYFAIQQIENNIFVPIIMRKATGLNPIVVLFAMAVGYTLGDILGMVIAIPTTASLSIFLEDYLSKKK